ncbi:hypothetical protein BFP72_03625 [Reichenbachiella sp. 5M10]|uniref:M3 family metallopeptidase n=1 Tax=Reichenbachiella sp. 5M10 TaxID=1889772 RepID=UPI000C154B70|nr:M3 family metallopeptidase [Reichenbachiella sp. 5M10]PIB34563.1 hypothetical protein BFP72_03625 [Reichenbachiella sp. 5M10]
MKYLLTLLSLVLLMACEPNSTLVMPVPPADNALFRGFNATIDFDSLRAEDFAAATAYQIPKSRLWVQKIHETKDRSFENTMREIDEMYDEISSLYGVIYLMGSTHPDSAIRNAALGEVVVMEKYFNSLSLNDTLYQAVKAYAQTDEAKTLTGPRAKYLTETVQSFERNGFGLDEAGRAQLQVIDDKLSELGNTFGNNIASFEDHLIVDEAGIAGLPEDYKQARQTEDGMYKIDMSYPSVLPFFKYAQSATARQQLFVKFRSRAAESNMAVLDSLILMRTQKAQLLGYDTYAAYRVADRMAKTTQNVWDFENDLVGKVRPKAEADYAELLEVKSTSTGTQASEIDAWSLSYYENILLKDSYQLDGELIKQYFPLDGSIEGLFTITQQLFGVTYRELEDPSVWNDDVRLFEVLQGEQVIGRFYLDFFPRANKYSHAACFPIISGKASDRGRQIPTAALVCNFPKATDDKPSLMLHNQVETLFHEFGHVLHHMLSETELASQSGTSVSRDFVEAPSQIFENWTWNYDALKLFAKHYETGEVLPKALFDKMIRSKNVGSGMNLQRQIYYGMYDFTLYDLKSDGMSTDDVARSLHHKLLLYPFPEGTHLQTSFGHLDGYGASYYGYLWSKVYAQDMFSLFEQNGVLDQETGMRYRESILKPGGSMDENQMLVDFLGRAPQNDAFLKGEGVEISE